MTIISAEVVADSLSPEGARLTTMQLRYPRFIHAEFMTHRVFSRNASSSRAVPVKRIISQIERNPVVPLHWGRNEPGMQASEQLTRHEAGEAIEVWLNAVDGIVDSAKMLVELGVHKQIVNRLLEPFAHIDVLATATEWSNFFALRRHHDAEPHMRMLAEQMSQAMADSDPEILTYDEWHLPYIGVTDKMELALDTAIKCSVARCARVSYQNHDGSEPEVADDMILYDRLLGARPIHASPAEHQARPDKRDAGGRWMQPHMHGNLRGWIQYRKSLPGENL